MSAAVTCGSLSSSWAQAKDSPFKTNLRNKNRHNENGFRVSCVASTVGDPYKTLKIRRGASESEVKKAFRQLALQYHPDVCRGSNCGTKFHQINEAYDIVMSHLRGESRSPLDNYDAGPDDQPTYDDDWELSEEWMGWEAAGIRDYANPYIEMNM